MSEKYRENYDKCFNNEEPIEGLELSTLNYTHEGLGKALNKFHEGVVSARGSVGLSQSYPSEVKRCEKRNQSKRTKSCATRKS